MQYNGLHGNSIKFLKIVIKNYFCLIMSIMTNLNQIILFLIHYYEAPALLETSHLWALTVTEILESLV